ncbi:MAG: hypothetical protein ABSH25_03000 [Syntrophorhabdales bacterium]
MEKTISAGDMYRMLLDCPDGTGDTAWLAVLPLALMTGAARASVYAVHLARRGRVESARSFLVLADRLADDREGPYIFHLRSILAYLTGDTETAVTLALEAREGARDMDDGVLEADVLGHLREMHQTMGDIAAARSYEREAESVRRALANRHHGEAEKRSGRQERTVRKGHEEHTPWTHTK